MQVLLPYYSRERGFSQLKSEFNIPFQYKLVHKSFPRPLNLYLLLNFKYWKFISVPSGKLPLLK